MDFTFAFFFFIVITMSAVIHEYSHGWLADRLGDPTARLAGRLTLNPIAHIDPFGTLFLPLVLLLFSGGTFLFAYAKPVPINPYNLKNARYGMGLVAFAGPASNLITALIFGLLVRFLPPGPLSFYLSIIVYANLLLAVFNLVPISPLDGSKILYAVLPDSFYSFKVFLEQYGMFLLLIFIFFFFRLITPIIGFLFQLITGFPFF